MFVIGCSVVNLQVRRVDERVSERVCGLLMVFLVVHAIYLNEIPFQKTLLFGLCCLLICSEWRGLSRKKR